MKFTPGIIDLTFENKSVYYTLLIEQKTKTTYSSQ